MDQDQQPKPTQQYNPHTQNTLPYSQQQEAILPYNIQPGGTITYNLHHEQTPPHTQSEYSIPHSPQPEPDTTLPYNPSLPYPIKPYTQHNQTNPSDIVPT